MSRFEPDEIDRYARHLMLREIGGPGQQKLKAATVAIVGLGGLGAPAAFYLAAAGVGRLVLIDHDRAAVSNLQRQILFTTADVGALKVEAGARALSALNPHVAIVTHALKLSDENARATLSDATLALDGTDDFATRFAVDAACRSLAIPLVSGAVGRWEGQIGVFASGADPDAPCYRCLVPHAPPDSEPCSAMGVLGALTGVIGAMMAVEAVKIITGAGDVLSGRLLLYDALAATTRVIKLPRDPDCPGCGSR
jgi:molybdopterin/thiamine biosynthesis adenylyltransferase